MARDKNQEKEQQGNAKQIISQLQRKFYEKSNIV